MASLNPATWHRLFHLGAIAPGYQADAAAPRRPRVVRAGDRAQARPPGRRDRARRRPRVGEAHRAHPPRRRPRLHDPVGGRRGARDRRDPRPDRDRVARRRARRGGRAGRRRPGAGPREDRRRSSATSGRAGWRSGSSAGSGCAPGALASTFSHDAHNIVVVGADDQDMARAIARLTEIGGGVVVVEDRGVRAELAAPDRRPPLRGAARRGRRGEQRLHRRGARCSAARCRRRSRRWRSSRCR